MNRPLRPVVAALLAALVLSSAAPAQTLPHALFERYVESLRTQVGIPGLSAAVIQDGQVVWDRGFGRQDLERAIAATPDTPYSAGGLTQSLAAALLGICTERGTLNIDDPIRRFAADFPTDASVRQVLAHASGGSFAYDTSRFAALTSVVQTCSDEVFSAEMSGEILERLGMATSVPGTNLTDPSTAARNGFTPGQLERYSDVVSRMAVPYRVDRSGKANRTDYGLRSLDASSGLVSSVRDLARFEAALNAGVLLRPSSLGIAWTPADFGRGSLPTGVGWFVQSYEGARLVWQFSHEPDAYSAILLKIPARRLTLILMANSSALGTNLDQGDITVSPFIKIFLRLFVQ